MDRLDTFTESGNLPPRFLGRKLLQEIPSRPSNSQGQSGLFLFFKLENFFPRPIVEKYSFDFGEGKKWHRILDHILGDYQQDLHLPGLPTNQCFIFIPSFESGKYRRIPAKRCPYKSRIPTWIKGTPETEIPRRYCYCPGCLADRDTRFIGPQTLCGARMDSFLNARTNIQTDPIPEYKGSKYRCKFCDAVHGVPYPEFTLRSEKTLTGKDTKICQIKYNFICNRNLCLINQQFPQPIPEIDWKQFLNKGSYPSGCQDFGYIFHRKEKDDDWEDRSNTRDFKLLNRAPKWIDTPLEIPIHKNLIDWAQDPNPSDANRVIGTEGKILKHAKQDTETTSKFWELTGSLVEDSDTFQIEGGKLIAVDANTTRIEGGEYTGTAVDKIKHTVEQALRYVRYFANSQFSQLDFGDSPSKIYILSNEAFQVVGRGFRSIQVQEEIKMGAQASKERFEKYEEHLKKSIQPSAQKAFKWEQKYRAAHSDPKSENYLPPAEISPDRVLNPNRETTRSNIEIREFLISDYAQWRNAILQTFGKKSVDFVFGDGLYMLVERPHQPPRVYLVFEERKADLGLYGELILPADSFEASCAQAAEKAGFSTVSFKGPCQVLRFRRHDGRVQVSINDWILAGSGDTTKQDFEAKPVESTD